MGGPRSGRWSWGKHDAKTLVEDCRALDINRMVQERVIAPQQFRRGGWQWSRDGQVMASVGYESDTRAADGTLRLIYSITRDGEAKSSQDIKIPLVTTQLVSGGRRWWFVCPARRVGGPPCRRRVAKLYLPPGASLFACRHCYDLAYTSSRESRRYDRAFASLAAGMGLSFRDVKRQMMQLGRTRREDARIRKNSHDLVKRAEKIIKRCGLDGDPDA